jgi:hypothetical protein
MVTARFWAGVEWATGRKCLMSAEFLFGMMKNQEINGYVGYTAIWVCLIPLNCILSD